MAIASTPRSLAFFLVVCGAVSAAPRLRLANSVVLVQVAAGATAPTQILEAFNIGDGSLALGVSVPQAAGWVSPSVGAPHACMSAAAGTCIPLEFSLNTANLAQGTYTTFVTVSDPQAADAPQEVSVTVQVATGGVTQILAPGADGYYGLYYGPSSNCGHPFGCLPPFDAKAHTEDEGTWMAVVVSARDSLGLYWTAYINLTPSATMAPGAYNGSVAITNSNDDRTIPVTMSLLMPPIAPQGPPVLFHQGVVDSATLAPGITVAPGDVITAFGQELSAGAPVQAAGAPLPTSLGAATVLVNGVEAPLFYSSFGQIVFQMPSRTAAGTAQVQVMRDGQTGNTVEVNVAQRAPEIVAVTDLSYNPRDVSHPAHAGETLVLWSIGLGPTAPNVPDGAPAPADPPAILTVPPTAHFSGSVERDVAPSFAGLSAGGVGLYQVQVTIPTDMPAGLVSVALLFPGLSSNVVPIAVN